MAPRLWAPCGADWIPAYAGMTVGQAPGSPAGIFPKNSRSDSLETA